MKIKIFNLKFLSPRTLYGRFLLIILLPILLVQLSGIYVFYYRNWDNMSKHMARSFIKEITLVREIINDIPPSLTEQEYNEILKETDAYFNIKTHFTKNKQLPRKSTSRDIDVDYLLSTSNPFVRLNPLTRFKTELSRTFPDINFHIDDFSRNNLLVSFELEQGTLQVIAYKKHISNPGMNSYILASILVSMLIAIISIIFLKNQIRSIKNLTKAVQRVGKGYDDFTFKPSGATEIRKAGISFLRMRKRIQNFIKQRTEMLSGISHDLRTPLTRMNLELELLPEDETVISLKEDIHDMEKMINEYLAFAKGEESEKRQEHSIAQTLENTIKKYTKINKQLEFDNRLKSDIKISYKKRAIERVLNNIIDNGFKYGKGLVKITLDKTAKSIKIVIEDNGKGLPDKDKKNIFKPFYKGDNSRNLTQASTGLGMSIVQDIIRSHGGNIAVQDSELGGLKIKIFLPL